MTILLWCISILSITLPFFHMLHAFFHRRGTHSILPHEKKEFSLLIPCYNEEHMVRTTIEALATLRYPDKEIIFINDGSPDRTLDVLLDCLQAQSMQPPRQLLNNERFINIYKSKRYKSIYVIDKENGGKFDALNTGIAMASKELIVTLDADCILHEHALEILHAYFQDPDLIAAGGTVHILQGRSSHDSLGISLKLKHIVRFQILEYLKGFYVYKMSLAQANALAIISGAFGVFRRDVLLEINGYQNTIGEDIDVTVRLHKWIQERPGKKVGFIPEAVVYTECPEGWHDLYKQRVRWQKAFMDALFNHGGFLLRTFLKSPLSFFFLLDSVVTGLISPYILTLTYLLLLIRPASSFHSASKLALLLVTSFASTLIYSLASLMKARQYGVHFHPSDKLRLFGALLCDMLLFRCVTLFFILYGSLAYFFNQTSWNKVARTGRSYSIQQGASPSPAETSATLPPAP